MPAPLAAVAAVAASALLPLLGASPLSAAAGVDLSSPAGWKGVASEGVALEVGPEGSALRVTYDFRGRAGYAIVRKEAPVPLPANWRFRFRVSGSAPANDLEFKLADASGENVWWSRRRAFSPTLGGTEVVVRRRQVEFAWGPAGGGEPRNIAAVELAFVAGPGGKGSVLVEGLSLEELPAPRPIPERLSFAASSSAPGFPASGLEGDPPAGWRSAPDSPLPQWVEADLGGPAEFGGLVLRWGRDFAPDYDVRLSDDRVSWRTVRRVKGVASGTAWLALPESEARWVRVATTAGAPGRGFELRGFSVEPLSFGASPNALFERIAAAAPRGRYPRYLLREQSYWTVVGTDGDDEKGLISADGAIEPAAGTFSVEPLLLDGAELLTWADVESVPSLLDGYLPVPSVRWTAKGLSLETTAFAEGLRGDSRLWIRWRVTNRGREDRSVTLVGAIRPFQVNPSWQFLAVQGGSTRIDALSWDGAVLTVEAPSGRRRVIPLVPPDSFGALPFDAGTSADRVVPGGFPSPPRVEDPEGFASGALSWRFDLPAGDSRDVVAVLPIQAGREFVPPASSAAAASAASSASVASALFDRTLAKVAGAWRQKLNRVTFTLPPEAKVFADTARSNLAYVLVNRDGPAIQPGSRSYRRSWIRDGSLTSAALLRLGHAREAKEFAEWFAPYQFESGAVPCCVDRRGADPVPEHDSHGQLVYLVAEVYRHTGDATFARNLFPHVRKAAAAIDRLRGERRTPEWREKDGGVFFGLLPPSISHEGYSAKPMHSYWDDFFALRGLKDAAFLAGALGLKGEETALARSRDEFEAELLASLKRTMEVRKIGFLPGCADLGDFDPTSTTAAVSPGGEESKLPREALLATFGRYWEESVSRSEGRRAWKDYTPYEWRTVGTLARLGRGDRAMEMARFFMADRRPPGWNHWAEIVWRDPKEPRFIGDMPHGWVGTDFIRSFLDLFAYERESDGALVLAAGLGEWLAAPEGVGIAGLSTWWGPLTYTLQSTGRLTVEGSDGKHPGGLRFITREGAALTLKIEKGLRMPPGGVVLALPSAAPPLEVKVNGQRIDIASMKAAGAGPMGTVGVRIREIPATVEVRW